MEPVYYLASFFIAAFFVLVTAYLILKSLIKNREKDRELEIRRENQRTVTPIRLQAYERLILLLERMSPNSLILRTKKKGMTATDLQAVMIAEIKAEFDHNLSQQLYISHEAWELVKNTREEIIKMIHVSYSKMNGESTALDLSKEIFDQYMGYKVTPIEKSLDFLKKEAHELF